MNDPKRWTGRFYETSFVKVQCCTDCGWAPRYNRFLAVECCPLCGSEKMGEAVGKYRILQYRKLFIFKDTNPECFIYKNGDVYRFSDQTLITKS